MEYLDKVVPILEEPARGLAFSTAVWTALYLVVIFVPGISDKNFDFKVSPPLKWGKKQAVV